METAKHLLVTSDPWMSGMEIHEVGKGPVRTSEMIDPYWNRLGSVNVREALSIGWDRCGWDRI